MPNHMQASFISILFEYSKNSPARSGLGSKIPTASLFVPIFLNSYAWARPNGILTNSLFFSLRLKQSKR